MDLETTLMQWTSKNMPYLLLNKPTINFRFPSDSQNDHFKIGVLEFLLKKLVQHISITLLGLNKSMKSVTLWVQ